MKIKRDGVSTLLVVIVLLLVVVIAGGVVGYFYLFDADSKDEQVVTPIEKDIKIPTIQKLEKGKDEEKISQIGPLYPLDPFTVNLRSDKGDVYLKITLNLELSLKELSNELDAKNAVIRDLIIRILSSKTYENFASDSGKEKVLDEIADRINAMLHDGYIKNVYITEFVVQ
jgi:flagellar FliL protein